MCEHEPGHKHELAPEEELPRIIQSDEADDDYRLPNFLRRQYNRIGILAINYYQPVELQAQMAVACPCATCLGTGAAATLLAKVKTGFDALRGYVPAVESVEEHHHLMLNEQPEAD